VPGSLLKGAPKPRGKATSENGLAYKVCPDQGSGKRSGALAEWPSRQPNRAPRRGGERGRPVPARPQVAAFVTGGPQPSAGVAYEHMIVPMMLAGLRVPDDDVREPARLVDEPTKSVLEKALALGTVVLALTIEDRERLLGALDDARIDALAELRGVLLLEHEGRVREGPA
jgi:hypothetical protein